MHGFETKPFVFTVCFSCRNSQILPQLAVITPNQFEVFELANAWRNTMGLPLLDPKNPTVPHLQEEEEEEDGLVEKSSVEFKGDGTFTTSDQSSTEEVPVAEEAAEDEDG